MELPSEDDARGDFRPRCGSRRGHRKLENMSFIYKEKCLKVSQTSGGERSPFLVLKT